MCISICKDYHINETPFILQCLWHTQRVGSLNDCKNTTNKFSFQLVRVGIYRICLEVTSVEKANMFLHYTFENKIAKLSEQVLTCRQQIAVDEVCLSDLFWKWNLRRNNTLCSATIFQDSFVCEMKHNFEKTISCCHQNWRQQLASKRQTFFGCMCGINFKNAPSLYGVAWGLHSLDQIFICSGDVPLRMTH